MFRFAVCRSMPIWEGKLLYEVRGSGLDFECSVAGPANPVGWRDIASLLLETVQIEVDIEQWRLLWALGYCPIDLPTWRGRLPLPRVEPGGVTLQTDRELLPGVAYPLGERARWRPRYDPDTGWACIGEVKAPPGADWVEFATNTVAVISQGEFVALWLRPEFVPRPAQVTGQRSAGADSRQSLRVALSNVARTLRRMGHGSDDS